MLLSLNSCGLGLHVARNRRGRAFAIGLLGRDDDRRHLRLDLGDVGDDRGQAAAFADELGLQPRQDRQPRQGLQALRRRWVEIADALAEQQRLDPVAVGRLLLDEPLVLAVRPLRVLFGFAGNLDHPAGVELAPNEARQGPHELVDVDAVRLDAARPPVDRHARRLDLVGVVARRLQGAIEPMTVSPGLEARVNLGRKAASLLLARRDAAQQRQQAVEVAAVHLMPANRPLLRRADPHEPLRTAQFQCNENRGKLSRGDGRNLLNKHDSILCSGFDASTIGVEAPAAA